MQTARYMWRTLIVLAACGSSAPGEPDAALRMQHTPPPAPSAIDPVELVLRTTLPAPRVVWWDGRAHDVELTHVRDDVYATTLPASSRLKLYRFVAGDVWLDGAGEALADDGTRDDFAIRPTGGPRIVHYDTGFAEPLLVTAIGMRVMTRERAGRFGAIVDDAGAFSFVDAATHARDLAPAGVDYESRWSELWVRDGVVYDVDPDGVTIEAIDAHAHPIPAATLQAVMTKHAISYALVSTNQDQAALAALAAADPRVVPLRWFVPGVDSVTDVEEDLRDRRFRGLKFHPAVTGIAADDARLDPFIRLAIEYDVAVVIHTAIDAPSRPARVAALAARHPRARLVMYHLELGALDKAPALQEVQAVPNVTVETSWTNATGVLTAFSMLDSSRVMFGTDAVTDGLDHFTKRSIPDETGQYTLGYEQVIAGVQARANPNAYANWRWRTAMRVFRIPLLPPPDRLDSDGDGVSDGGDVQPTDPNAR